MTSVTNSYENINFELVHILLKDTYKDHKDLATNPRYYDIIQKAFKALDSGINIDESGKELDFNYLHQLVEQQKLAVLFLDVDFSDDKTGKRYFDLRTLAMENVRKLKTYPSYLINATELDDLFLEQSDENLYRLSDSLAEVTLDIKNYSINGSDEGFMKLYEKGIQALEHFMLFTEYANTSCYQTCHGCFGRYLDLFIKRNPFNGPLDNMEAVQKLVKGCRPVFDQQMHILFTGFEKGDEFCKEELLKCSIAVKKLKEEQDKIKKFQDKLIFLLWQPYIDKILSEISKLEKEKAAGEKAELA